MSEEPDLVRLLYRADWTRLSLAAAVSASEDPSRDPGWLLGGVPPAPPPGTWPWSWPPGGSWATPFSGWPGGPEGSAVWDEPPGKPGPSSEPPESETSREAPLWRRFGGSGRPPWAGHEWEYMFDASWLLGRQLTGGQEVVTDGRLGYRLRGSADVKPPGGWFFFPDEIVVDTELGILLRWISLAGEQPLTRYELRDVVVGLPEPGAFRPDIPPGVRVRVAEESRDQPPSGPVNPWGLVARQAAKEARSALRNVLGALRNYDKR